jgi:hypothetical protein
MDGLYDMPLTNLKMTALVLAAVQKHGWALEYAYDELKNDRALVLTAVYGYGWALEYASREFLLRSKKMDGL